MRKLWFTCYECQTDFWLPAIRSLLDEYNGITDDILFCPWCENYRICQTKGTRKPARLLFTEDMRRTHGY